MKRGGLRLNHIALQHDFIETLLKVAGPSNPYSIGVKYSLIVLGLGCFDLLIGQMLFSKILYLTLWSPSCLRQYQTGIFVLLTQRYYCSKMGTFL